MYVRVCKVFTCAMQASMPRPMQTCANKNARSDFAAQRKAKAPDKCMHRIHNYQVRAIDVKLRSTVGVSLADYIPSESERLSTWPQTPEGKLVDKITTAEEERPSLHMVLDREPGTGPAWSAIEAIARATDDSDFCHDAFNVLKGALELAQFMQEVKKFVITCNATFGCLDQPISPCLVICILST